MANHRAMSDRRRRMVTVSGGVVAGVALVAVAPAAMAFADVSPGEFTGNRPNFTNPAPVVRGIQQIGDSTFDPQASDGKLVAGARAQLNASPVGQAYHTAFGYSATGAAATGDPSIVASNGKVTGVLNTGLKGGGDQFNPPTTIPGKVYAQTVNIHECQVKWSNNGGIGNGGWDGIGPATGGACGGGSG